MISKETTPLQISGKEVKGAGRVQTLNTMIIRGSTLKQSDGKDQSNRPNHHLKRKWAQRGGPTSKMNLAMAEHLRILMVKQDEARDDTRPFRPEGGEDHIIKTTGQAGGPGTRCQRAKRRRQVRP